MIPQAAPVTESAASSDWPQYLQLTKPRLTSMALATALLGYYQGSSGPFDFTLLFYTLIALAFIGAGANALNQVLEKDVDAKMKRTENRPLPSGRLSEKKALVFGMIMTVLGSLCLFAFVNTLTAVLAVATLFIYVLIYTPLKRKTPLNTFIGTVPGALPVVTGWTAATGSLGLEALTLFLILVFWQLPHFMAIAWFYKADYLKSGLKIMTLGDREGVRTGWQIVIGCLVLVPVTLAPAALGMTGHLYFYAALLCGLGFLGFAFYLAWYRMAHARSFVTASIYYLLLLVVTMMVDKAQVTGL